MPQLDMSAEDCVYFASCERSIEDCNSDCQYYRRFGEQTEIKIGGEENV